MSLNTLGFDEQAKRVNACGRVIVYRCLSCNGRAGRVSFHCKHPLCPFCAEWLAYKRAVARERMVQDLNNPILLTLKLPPNECLQEADRAIRKGLERARKSQLIRLILPDAFVYLETVESVKGWGRHVHIIGECYTEVVDDVLRKMIADEWCYITECPEATAHIKPLDQSEASTLVAALKYPQKPPNIQHKPDRVREWHDILKGKKSTWAWGALRKHPATQDKTQLDEPEKVDLSTTCPHCNVPDMLQVERYATGRRKQWARYRCTPLGMGWFGGPAPPRPARP